MFSQIVPAVWMIDYSDGKMDVATSASDSDEELLFLGLDAVYSTNCFQKKEEKCLCSALAIVEACPWCLQCTNRRVCELRIRWH